MQQLRYNFYTKAHNDAVKAVRDPAIEKMNPMEQLVQRARRLARENAMAHTQRAMEEHTYFEDLNRRTRPMVAISSVVGLNKTSFQGAKCVEDIRHIVVAAGYGSPAVIDELIASDYGNAMIKNPGFTGLQRALFDGVPSYMLERTMYFYKELARFYHHHRSVGKPFLVEFGASGNYHVPLREYAQATKQPLYYGLATNPEMTTTMRRVFGNFNDVYPDDLGDGRFLDPVRVWGGSGCGYLLGILRTYFSDREPELVGYPRHQEDQKLAIDEKFHLGISLVNLKHSQPWQINFSIGDGPIMSFFMDHSSVGDMVLVERS